MTDFEKSQIRQLQEKGYGYKKIATTLSLSVNAVKGYMRRNNPIEAKLQAEAAEGRCEACGKAFVQIPNGRTRRFCCAKCRTQWWNSHLDQVQRKAYYTLVCPHCGQEFISYGNKKRIYCSRKCYALARSKGANADG